ncbi:sugar transferase [Patescibacteria group bacterium]|nr:sugar transferase [Patescibacteria group bacterium]
MELIRLLIYYLFLFFLTAGCVPLGIIVWAMIRFTDRMPVLFCQKRTGKNGSPFVMYKFRTMRVGAVKEQNRLQSRNEADGPVFKIRNDPRFTQIGRFLSHTGLDELPQLYNVLRGEMALIGPRPLPVAEAKKLKPWMRERERIKPGIISPWILEGYHRESFEAWMKSDVRYVKQKAFRYDAALTIQALFFLLRLFVQELVAR